MKLKYLLIPTLAIISTKLFAQNNYFIPFDPETYRVYASVFALTDSCAVDTSFMEVQYNLHSKNILGSRPPSIQLQIGPAITKQTDMKLLAGCRNYSRQKIVDSSFSAFETTSTNLFFEQIQDRKTGAMKITCGDLLRNNRPKKYTDNPQIEWTLTDQTDSVSGYFCHTATTKFRGRTWNVWYTPEIPVQAGPWRLGGLPGLILRATDTTGSYRFECNGIKAAKEPIYEYGYKRIHDLKTAEAYQKYERNFYEHPYQAFTAEGDNLTVVVKGSSKTGKMIYLNENWEIPYDPIELE